MNTLTSLEFQWSFSSLIFMAVVIASFHGYVHAHATKPPQNTVTIPPSAQNSILKECGEKLYQVNTQTIQADNESHTDVVQINYCANVPSFISCVKSGLKLRPTWADIDQLLFGVILDLDGLGAAYAEMCARKEYFDANLGCMNSSESFGPFFLCVLRNFFMAYSISKSESHSDICSVYKEHTNCTVMPPPEVCDEDFVNFLDRNNRRILKPYCRRRMYGEDINATTRVAQNVPTTLLALFTGYVYSIL